MGDLFKLAGTVTPCDDGCCIGDLRKEEGKLAANAGCGVEEPARAAASAENCPVSEGDVRRRRRVGGATSGLKASISVLLRFAVLDTDVATPDIEEGASFRCIPLLLTIFVPVAFASFFFLDSNEFTASLIACPTFSFDCCAVNSCHFPVAESFFRNLPPTECMLFVMECTTIDFSNRVSDCMYLCREFVTASRKRLFPTGGARHCWEEGRE